LSFGRAAVAGKGAVAAQLAAVIATRYSAQLCATSRELHVLGCAAKVILTETGVNALDEARLACGGHGFLRCSRLNDLRDSFDPSRTFEGDNNILLQQVTNALLSAAEEEKNILKNSPLGSFAFLKCEPAKFTSWKDDPLEGFLFRETTFVASRADKQSVLRFSKCGKGND
uniref:ACOX domain-containing protein n=1 Tax=Gongylonema pulchrum TaxID=637853 RepID=A0A183EGK3_9BILA